VGGFGFGRIWALSSAILRICRNLVMFGEDLTKLSLVARMENLGVMKFNLFEWWSVAGGGEVLGTSEPYMGFGTPGGVPGGPPLVANDGKVELMVRTSYGGISTCFHRKETGRGFDIAQ